MQNASAYYGHKYALMSLYINCVPQTDIFVMRDATANDAQKMTFLK